MSSLPLPLPTARMPRPSDAIDAYVHAKDRNQPHLMQDAFADDARLRMLVRTTAISFPPEVRGRVAITDTLVRHFNQVWENVHTLCLGAPPAAGADAFSCEWLVVMSGKRDGGLRAGCGRYDWVFGDDGRVRALDITIDTMESAACELAPVMGWVSALPWPWCARTALHAGAPRVAIVQDVLGRLQAA
ncbi:MAG: hypothetical protein ACTHL8_15510 [Burkholderiaceae bacterium]